MRSVWVLLVFLSITNGFFISFGSTSDVVLSPTLAGAKMVAVGGSILYPLLAAQDSNGTIRVFKWGSSDQWESRGEIPRSDTRNCTRSLSIFYTTTTEMAVYVQCSSSPDRMLYEPSSSASPWPTSAGSTWIPFLSTIYSNDFNLYAVPLAGDSSISEATIPRADLMPEFTNYISGYNPQSCITAPGNPSIYQICTGSGIARYRTLVNEFVQMAVTDVFLSVVCSWPTSDDSVRYHLITDGSIVMTVNGSITHSSNHLNITVDSGICYVTNGRYYLITQQGTTTNTYALMYQIFIGTQGSMSASFPTCTRTNSKSISSSKTRVFSTSSSKTRVFSTSSSKIAPTITLSQVVSSSSSGNGNTQDVVICNEWSNADCTDPQNPVINGSMVMNHTTERITVPQAGQVRVLGDMSVVSGAELMWPSSVQGQNIAGGKIVIQGTLVVDNATIHLETEGLNIDGLYYFNDMITYQNMVGDFLVVVDGLGSKKRDAGCVVTATRNGSPTSYGLTVQVQSCQDQLATSSENSMTGVIVGSAVGGAALIGLISIVAIVLTLRYRRRDKMERAANVELSTVMLKDVRVEKKIGSGAFGEVYLGTWSGNQVALKKMVDHDSEEFLNEVATLSRVKHVNIVQYYGICIEDGVQWIVMEYMSGGSLHSLLLRQNLDPATLINIARQCCAGMLHLQSHKIVHRDLALRNVLIASEKGDIAKIADFGMSRVIKKEIVDAKDDRIPVRWSSPEVILHKQFSTASDVWAFGILLWELFSEAQMPYPGMSNVQVIEEVVQGNVMSPAHAAPASIQSLMTSTWAIHPQDRPSFDDIHKILSNST